MSFRQLFVTKSLDNEHALDHSGLKICGGGNTCGIGTGNGKVVFGISCIMEGIGSSVLSLTISSSKAWIFGIFGNSLLSTDAES